MCGKKSYFYFDKTTGGKNDIEGATGGYLSAKNIYCSECAHGQQYGTKCAKSYAATDLLWYNPGEEDRWKMMVATRTRVYQSSPTEITLGEWMDAQLRHAQPKRVTILHSHDGHVAQQQPPGLNALQPQPQPQPAGSSQQMPQWHMPQPSATQSQMSNQQPLQLDDDHPQQVLSQLQAPNPQLVQLDDKLQQVLTENAQLNERLDMVIQEFQNVHMRLDRIHAMLDTTTPPAPTLGDSTESSSADSGVIVQ